MTVDYLFFQCRSIARTPEPTPNKPSPPEVVARVQLTSTNNLANGNVSDFEPFHFHRNVINML